MVKNLPINVGGAGSIPGWGWSSGEGNGTPLQYSCLGNPMGRGALLATVHGLQSLRATVAKDQTWLSPPPPPRHTHTGSGKVNLKTNKQKLLELKVWEKIFNSKQMDSKDHRNIRPFYLHANMRIEETISLSKRYK